MAYGSTQQAGENRCMFVREVLLEMLKNPITGVAKGKLTIEQSVLCLNPDKVETYGPSISYEHEFAPETWVYKEKTAVICKCCYASVDANCTKKWVSSHGAGGTDDPALLPIFDDIMDQDVSEAQDSIIQWQEDNPSGGIGGAIPTSPTPTCAEIEAAGCCVPCIEINQRESFFRTRYK